MLTPRTLSDQDKMLVYLAELHQSQIDRGLITLFSSQKFDWRNEILTMWQP